MVGVSRGTRLACCLLATGIGGWLLPAVAQAAPTFTHRTRDLRNAEQGQTLNVTPANWTDIIDPAITVTDVWEDCVAGTCNAITGATGAHYADLDGRWRHDRGHRDGDDRRRRKRYGPFFRHRTVLPPRSDELALRRRSPEPPSRARRSQPAQARGPTPRPRTPTSGRAAAAPSVPRCRTQQRHLRGDRDRRRQDDRSPGDRHQRRRQRSGDIRATATVIAPGAGHLGGYQPSPGPPSRDRRSTASTGTWTNTPVSYTYQWESCSGTTCTAISGATASTYAVAATDVGKTLEVLVTATNTGGSSTPAASVPTAVVVPPAPDRRSSLRRLWASTNRASVLTELHGGWTNSPTAYGYQWRPL